MNRKSIESGIKKALKAGYTLTPGKNNATGKTGGALPVAAVGNKLATSSVSNRVAGERLGLTVEEIIVFTEVFNTGKVGTNYPNVRFRRAAQTGLALRKYIATTTKA